MPDFVEELYEQMNDDADESGGTVIHVKNTHFLMERNGLPISATLMERDDHVVAIRSGWTPDGVYVNLSGFDIESGEQIELTVLRLEHDVHVST